jgi:hypothetical protein
MAMIAFPELAGGRQLVLKNTFLVEESAATPARPRACSDSFFSVRDETPTAEKLKASLSDEETELGSQDATEFPLTDDESSCSQEPAFDFERAAKANVRLLREGLTKPKRSADSSSSSSSSCGAVPMPMPMLQGAGFFPGAMMQQPMFSFIVIDPSQQAVKPEESASRKRKQRGKNGAKAEEGAKSTEDNRTTVMLRNLPRDFSRDVLLKLLDDNGFAGKYNFVYMPIDFVRQAGLGYAFVNLTLPEVVKDFWEAFDGFSAWPVDCEKVCRVNWSSPHQGYEEHVQRYRNSPLMHADVPDECRPVLLENGVRVDFPPPTKSLRAPRLRASRQRCAFWDQEQGEASDCEAACEAVTESPVESAADA